MLFEVLWNQASL